MWDEIKMANPVITRQQFKELLPLICDEETSSDQKGWSKENPLWGNCAVVALVAQNLFGGELRRASLNGTPFAELRSHYWNAFPDGTMEDFTASQFQENYPITGNTPVEVRSRHSLLVNLATGQPQEILKRYKLLAWRLAKALNPGNPLFENWTYAKCFDAALESDCQKMWFGCVIRHRGAIVATARNQFIAMLGACGHAEEFAIWEAAAKKIPLSECDLFIAGFYPTGLPWLKTEAEHTCLVGAIWVPVQNHWQMISASDATGKKEAKS